jgi:hypothetical protein
MHLARAITKKKASESLQGFSFFGLNYFFKMAGKMCILVFSIRQISNLKIILENRQILILGSI